MRTAAASDNAKATAVPGRGSADVTTGCERERPVANAPPVVSHLAVFAAVPDVEDVVGGLDVALLVELDRAEHGLPRAALLRLLGPDLDRRVGVEDVALGIDVLGLELLHHGLRAGALARVGGEGHHRALARRSGDLPELVGDQRVAADERGGHPLLLGLADDQPGLGVVAADIDHLDAGLLQARDQRRVVVLARRVVLVHRLLHAERVELLAGLVGEAFAVRGVVVEDGDLVVLEVGGEELAGDLALLVVTAADAERVPAALVGELRVRRRRRDLQDVLVAIHLAGRDRAARTVVAGDEHDALARELVGHRHGLTRVARVVADGQLELLAQYAALGV